MSEGTRPTIADAERCLHEVFGYRGFRPGQAEVIEAVLARQDALAIMPTGAGKSLCYQIPSVLLPGTTLVISPLIALMKDQVDSLLAEARARAGYLNSSVDAGERRRILRRLVDGWYDLLYIAPERLRSRSFLWALSNAPVGLLVVDEAHCISEWGHDFRPDYLHIPEAFARDTRPPVLAVTATATPKVRDDIRRQLGITDGSVLALSVDRPNLSFWVRSTPTISAKLAAVQELLPREPGSAAIIYCGTRAQTEEVAGFVRSVVGVPCAAYHAGLDGAERTRVQDLFMTDRIPIVAATTAFGMGIDKESIRCVLHFTVPESVEAYYQQAGRAGRDGEPAKCVLFYAPDDRALLEYFASSGAIRRDELVELWDTIYHRAAPAADGSLEAVVSVADLSAMTGLPEQRTIRGIELLCSHGPLQRRPDVAGDMRLLPTTDRLSRQVEAGIMTHVENSLRAHQEQLRAIVGYAESGECRRRSLVGHFGQEPEGTLDVCCDNCDGGATLSGARSREQLAILRCVGEMRWSVGRQLTMEILAGAETQRIRQHRLYNLATYSALRAMRRESILSLIDSLIAEGLLKQKGSDRPVLALTPGGQRVLEVGEELPAAPETPPEQVCEGAAASAGVVQDTERIRSLIFSCLAELPYRLGRTRIAEILVGSGARRIVEEGLDELGSHGACRGLAREDVLAQIDALIGEGRLQLQGHLRPVVVPSPVGAPHPERREGPAPAGVEPAQGEASASIADFLTRPRPQRIRLAHVDVGYSMDANSHFRGDTWQRTRLGEMLYALKYRRCTDAARDVAGQVVEFLGAHSDLSASDGLIGVPPAEDGEGWDAVSAVLQRLSESGQTVLSGALRRSRTAVKQKAVESAVEKQRNVRDAFIVVRPELVCGRRLLLVDDLVDSGATLNECAHALKAAGAATVNALAVTRTIHHAG